MISSIDVNELKNSIKLYAHVLKEEAEASDNKETLLALSNQVIEAFMLVDFAHKGIKIHSQYTVPEGNVTKPREVLDQEEAK